MNTHWKDILKKSLRESKHSRSDFYWFGSRMEDFLAYRSVIDFKSALSLNFSEEIINIHPEMKFLSFEALTQVRKDWNSINMDSLFQSTLGMDAIRLLLNNSGEKNLLCYYPSQFMERLSYINSRLGRLNVLSNNFIIRHSLYDKFFVKRTVSSRGIQVVPFIIHSPHLLEFEDLRDLFPNARRFVVQEAHGTSGIRTSLLRSKEDFRVFSCENRDSVITISPFIKGTPVNVNACVYRGKTWAAFPSVQIIGAPLCSDRVFGFCGSDFSHAKTFLQNNTLDDIFKMTIEIGEWLITLGYRGIFGLDFIVDENGKPFFLEINPRFQASTPYLIEEQMRQGFPPLICLHIAAFLNLEIGKLPSPFDYYSLPLQGGYVIMHHNSSFEGRTISMPDSGLYEMNNGHISKTDEVKLSDDLKAKRLFAIHAGAPSKGTIVEKSAQLFKVSFSGEILGKNLSMKKHISETVETVRKSIDIKPFNE